MEIKSLKMVHVMLPLLSRVFRKFATKLKAIFSYFFPLFSIKKQAGFQVQLNCQYRWKIFHTQVGCDVPKENLKILILQQDQFCTLKRDKS